MVTMKIDLPARILKYEVSEIIFTCYLNTNARDFKSSHQQCAKNS